KPFNPQLKDPEACLKLSASGLKGSAKPATAADYKEMAESAGVEVAALRPLADLHHDGIAFVNGRPWMMLNYDRFYEYFPDAQAKLGSSLQSGDIDQVRNYNLVQNAMKIHCAAALGSTRWGLFGIIGDYGSKTTQIQFVDEFVLAH